MTAIAQILGLLAAAVSLTACSSPQIDGQRVEKSDSVAVGRLAASKRAHGIDAFRNMRDLSVRYDGKWGAVGPRFQPVLVDSKFRGGSEERLLLRSQTIAQVHFGPAGVKHVLRVPGNVEVAYNGAASTDEQAKRAAALVADAYTMFLLGPFYFDRHGVVLSSAGETTVDGFKCDQVLAVLRPGFGMADEDRVVLSIDRASNLLRRVRMTLNGLESTRGAEVDVTFREFRTIGGVVWPTNFDERIRVPFDLHAHHWKMLGLEINRGFTKSDLTAGGLKGRAAKPTNLLPVNQSNASTQKS